jgi:hypothetical protein
MCLCHRSHQRYKLQDQQDQQYKLYAAADSDLAGDPITRRSQTDWFVFYNDGPIVWKVELI